jgi:hypothetical protein
VSRPKVFVEKIRYFQIFIHWLYVAINLIDESEIILPKIVQILSNTILIKYCHKSI